MTERGAVPEPSCVTRWGWDQRCCGTAGMAAGAAEEDVGWSCCGRVCSSMLQREGSEAEGLIFHS